MKSHTVYRLYWVSVFLFVILMPGLVVKSLQAAEAQERDIIGPETPVPSTYRKFSDSMNLIAGFDVLYTHSDLKGSASLSGGNINVLIAPTYEFSENNMFILMYNGAYYKKRDFYSDDIGPQERSEYQRHGLTPMLRMAVGEKPGRHLVPSFFITQTYNKDIEFDDWDDGLYNYRDLGAGLDYEIKDVGLGNSTGTLKVGMQFYKRKYPNYQSLLDTQVGIDTEVDEKDYNGIIASVDYNCFKESGFSWRTTHSLLYKMLDDKKVIKSNGYLSSKQQDYIYSLDIISGYTFNESLKMGLSLNCSWKDSNQNYFEMLPPDVYFTSDFYDYFSWKFKPNMAYKFESFPLKVDLSYGFKRTDYSDRKAKNTNGTPKPDEQWESEQEVNLDLSYSINEKWNILCKIQYVECASNNADESIYRYDYTVKNYSMGVSYMF